MFVCENKNPSGVISVQVVGKSSGKYVVKKTVGSSNDVSQIERLVIQAQRGKQLRGAVGSQHTAATDFSPPLRFSMYPENRGLDPVL
jgi:hypothetical protein